MLGFGFSQLPFKKQPEQNNKTHPKHLLRLITIYENWDQQEYKYTVADIRSVTETNFILITYRLLNTYRDKHEMWRWFSWRPLYTIHRPALFTSIFRYMSILWQDRFLKRALFSLAALFNYTSALYIRSWGDLAIIHVVLESCFF